MSDKLSDDECARIRAATIEECAKVCESSAKRRWYAEDKAREGCEFCADEIRALAASPAPAIHMPPLNDTMRAVLTNENCIYGTPDELYAALVKAAPAISESEDAARLDWLTDRLEDAVIDGADPAKYLPDDVGDGNEEGAAACRRAWRLAIDAARKGEKS